MKQFRFSIVFSLTVYVFGYSCGQVVRTAKDVTLDLKENDLAKNTIDGSSATTEKNVTIVEKTLSKVCPNIERVPFFSFPCETKKQCSFLGPDMLCCKSRCLRGVDPPKPTIKHEPFFFGLVERICPLEPLAELLEVKECTSDADCTPRICCPDNSIKAIVGKSYCRTAAPNLEKLPFAKRLFQPVQTFVSFMQCSPPPPPVLDIFPKECRNPIDCFPNLCCQEGGKKYCRPPKRSLLTLMAGVVRRFGSSEFAKSLIERITT